MEPPSVSYDALPLVGRVREFADTVNALRTHSASAVLVSGAAGIGRSRFASEVARDVPGRHGDVVLVAGTRALRSVPFGPFAIAISGFPSGDPASVIAAASDLLAARNHPHPVLLVVDDAHSLDDYSAALLLHLARSRTCRILVTVRSFTDVPEPVTALWKDHAAERVELGPLSESDVELLASTALNGPLAVASTRWLVDRSRGNPMYIRELLLGAAAQDALKLIDGLWVVTPSFAPPDRLIELIAERFSELSPTATDVLDLLVLGEPLTYELLVTVSGSAAVEDAENRGVIARRDQPGPAVAGMSHPLFTEVRRQQMPYERVRRLSQVLVANVERAEPPSREQMIRLGRWYLDAELDADAELLTEAAVAARSEFDLDLAKRLARAAVAAGAAPRAGLTLGEALFFSGEHAEAEQVFADLMPQCVEQADLARVAHARAYNLGTLMGDRARAEAILADVAPRLDDPVARLRVTQSLTNLRILAGEPHPALEDALLMIDCTDDGIAERGHQFAAIAAAFVGEGERALAIAEDGLAIRRRKDLVTPASSQLIASTLALYGLGRFAEAERVARDCCEDVGVNTRSEELASFSLLGGLVAIEQGRHAAAQGLFREALAINRDVDDVASVRWCLGGLALSAAMQGDAGAAARELAELDAVGPHWMGMFEFELIDRGRAWAAVARGQLADAQRDLLAAADRARAVGRNVAEALLRHDVARLGAPQLVSARLDELAEIVDGQYVRALAIHAQSASDRDLERLEEAANRFERLGALLLAAEVGTAVAEQFERQAEARRANPWRLHVDELLEQCGPVQTPALSRRGNAVRLTKREHEIVALAASGASSKHIADRLVLSARTVENHLQRAYIKLGVTGREELLKALQNSG